MAEQVCEENHLIASRPWIDKMLQLYATQKVRHGIIVMGPSGASKTALIDTLAKSLSRLTPANRNHQNTKTWHLNPKSLYTNELFGTLDAATGDWTDGTFTTLWRKSMELKSDQYVWIVHDGPVDTIWIESLNSVLDDSKILTLANGDRLSMSPNVKLMFEAADIDNASPATVSRNGVIYVSSNIVGWSNLLDSWLAENSTFPSADIKPLFKAHYEDILNFGEQSLAYKMPVLNHMVTMQCLTIFKASIETNHCTNSEINFVYAILWSVGALCEQEDRGKLCNFLTEKGLDCQGYDFYPDVSGWKKWEIPAYSVPELTTQIGPMGTPFSQILVPTVDTVTLKSLMTSVNKNVLLIGEPGSGKTSLMNSWLVNKVQTDESQAFESITMSDTTTPPGLQNTILSFMDKTIGTSYAPKNGKNLTIFIDDINMPEINEWNDQITNELLRQLIEQKGFYNRGAKAGDFLCLDKFAIMGSMAQPLYGRNDIPMRLKRQFIIFNSSMPKDRELNTIFGTIARNHFVKNNFCVDIQESISEILEMTYEIWSLSKRTKLPTPAKFFYQFSIRDMSRIWQSMTQVDPETINSKVLFRDLWHHEVTRVINDRFIDDDDRNWFSQNLKQIEEKYWNGESCQENVHVNFMRDAPEPTGDEPDDFDFSPPKIYEPVPVLGNLQDRIQLRLDEHDDRSRDGKLRLVLFDQAVRDIAKMARVLSNEQGNALLLGVGGSGKRSLSKLASYIVGNSVFRIQITKAYNRASLNEDLKKVFKICGVENKGVSFVLTDSDIKDDTFMEPINTILSTGYIQYTVLFNKEEIEELYAKLENQFAAQYPKIECNKNTVFSFFERRIRSNIHMVICMSPAGAALRRLTQKFPALLGGSSIITMKKWPRDAMITVAKKLIFSEEYFKTLASEDELEEKLCSVIADTHDNVDGLCGDYYNAYRRVAFVTPGTYLSFIKTFKQVYKKQREVLDSRKSKLDQGLQRLQEAKDTVAVLQEELKVKNTELDAQKIVMQEVLAKVTKKAEESQREKERVGGIANQAQMLVDEITVNKEKADEMLKEALPALEKAETALKVIDSKDIAAIRNLPRPPPLIMRILDCILILMGKQIGPVEPDVENSQKLGGTWAIKPSWVEAKKLMAKPGFLTDLEQFLQRPNNLNDETCEILKESYFQMPDYNEERASTISGSCVGLLKWTMAMVEFFLYNKKVIPLKDKLAQQEVLSEKAQIKKQAAEADLAIAEADLKATQEEYETANRKFQALIDDANLCNKRLENAHRLISGLGDERQRWMESSKNLKNEIKQLTGDAFLGSAFLSYIGPFNSEYRHKLLVAAQKKLRVRDIPHNTELTNATDIALRLFTSGEAESNRWLAESLPPDENSTQNAIVALNATRYPLLVDPQRQAVKWLKMHYCDALVITTLTAKDFKDKLEMAMFRGDPMLVLEVGESIDPILDNVISRNVIKVGRRYKIKIGDKEADYHENFRLFLATSLGKPKYSPEIVSTTAFTDFSVTMSGLEDQLLTRTILYEKAELEHQRQKLILEITTYKQTLQKNEGDLLERLNNVSGSVVDDTDLALQLESNKKTAIELEAKLAVGKETEIKLKDAREKYRKVAKRGASLFFLLENISLILNLYTTSLNMFLRLFDIALQDSEKTAQTDKRVQHVANLLTLSVHNRAMVALYSENRLTWALLLAVQTEIEAGTVSPAQFSTFARGGSALTMESCPKKALPNVSDLVWMNIVALNRNLPESFGNLITLIENNVKGWQNWINSEKPEMEDLPDGYENVLSSFNRMILIRACVPDRVIPEVRRYIARTKSLGDNPKLFAEDVPLQINRLYQQVNHEMPANFPAFKTPYIALLTQGGDPTSQLQVTAKENKTDTYIISMGQGQEPAAKKGIEFCKKQGHWMILQNCHLALDFVKKEVTELQTLDEKAVNPNFRLFITTEPHKDWPVSIIEQCIKFTTEPPVGIKAGLKRSFLGMDQTRLDSVTAPAWKKMVYATSFIYRALTERKRYGRIGWSIPYPFADSDMDASLLYIQNYLDELPAKKPISWKTVHYQIGMIQYGGRVTDDQDQNILDTLVQVWFNEDMFEEKFAFAKGYPMPSFNSFKGGLKGLISHAEHLPAVDKPDVVGLHSNAGINSRKEDAGKMLDTILNIQPKDSSSTSGGPTREEIVKEQVNQMLDKLPTKLARFEVDALFSAKHPVHNGFIHEPGMPMTILLRQELTYFWKVADNVKSTLETLVLAIDGLVVMSDKLTNAFNSIFDGKIPEVWMKGSWASSTLGFWFSELLLRWNQLSAWLYHGLPKSFRLASFFNKNAFLTGILQEITAKNPTWTLDKVKMKVEVLKFMTPEELPKKNIPEDGSVPERPSEYFIHDLWMEGGKWDKKKNCLSKSTPKILHEPMPIMKITGVQDLSGETSKKSKDRDASDKDNSEKSISKINHFACPIYSNSARTDLTYVTTVQLNCPKFVKKISGPPATMKKKKDKDGKSSSNSNFGDEDYSKIAVNLNQSDNRYWILQGTAIICNVN